ncbi:tripartite tricarboxylate transporter TctB family protein [Comamonas sp. BIGb0124]|uniref:tripartite tricarboxylate transporter TctB family protein n=1 Tax=Comamonas sp. BIGb0124 TaxID=2485130 RepID=UPI000F484B55|nr:tripartite tricarboxylate transporter TctB family protein [Comamonas sp. BIGb0124]ROR26491.1 tripartite tricarboxylate transporter TctB family protein [Comamonas sp. BIGb0124]
MKHRDTHDLLGGLAMLAAGVFFAVYGSRYNMGTAARMGPGYFPVILGWLLAVLGLLVALPAWWRQGSPIVVQWRNLFWSVASVVLFAVSLRLLGMALATFVSCLLALVPVTMPLKTRFILSAVISGLTVLIFAVGLRMILPVWPWSL